MSGIQLIEALTVVSDGLSEISEKSFWSLQVPVSMYPKTYRYISSERLYVPEWLVFYSSVCNIFQGLDYQIYLYALN